MIAKKYLQENLNTIYNAKCFNINELDGTTVLITGATGLIGFSLASTLLYYGQDKENAPKIIAFVRNINKAREMYAQLPQKNLTFLVSDVTEPINIDKNIDYIIHAASQTASKAFVSEPVETIRIAIDGTINMLELAKAKEVKGFIYLSSMEVYGAPETEDKIKENYPTNLDTMSLRTSYPEGKRMCETLCTAYYYEYNVPIKVIRLTQTFGPGVAYHDGRVFAEFARCIIEKRDIILNTLGTTKRNYLYTADAITAILTILLKGNNGEAYNVANEETYCSIYEMAYLVIEACSNDDISVKVEVKDDNNFGYAPPLKMNLDTSKLTSLGWKATKNLQDMYISLIESMKE